MDIVQELDEADGSLDVEVDGEEHTWHYHEPDRIDLLDYQSKSADLRGALFDQQEEIEKVRERFDLDEDDDPEEKLSGKRLKAFEKRWRRISLDVDASKLEPMLDLIAEHIASVDGLDNDWSDLSTRYRHGYLRKVSPWTLFEVVDEISPGLEEDKKNGSESG